MLARSESRGKSKVRVLAVHTSEGNDRPNIDDAAALRDASWWTGSSHAIADNDPGSLLTPAQGCVPYERASWTLRSGNPWSENIELIGWAHWTRAEWLARPRLLDRCARWLADRSQARGIPLVKLSPKEYRAGRSGVIGHVDHTLGYSDGTHWDPGPGFPWDVVIAKARAYAGTATPTQDPEDDMYGPEQRDELITRVDEMRGELDTLLPQVAEMADGVKRLLEAAGPTRAMVANLFAREGADVDEDALAGLLADKLNGSSKAEIAAALRQVLRDGVGA